MKQLFSLAVFVCMALAAVAQDCSDPLILGYKGENTVTVTEAKRVILKSFVATTSCELKLTLRSGDLFIFGVEGEIVMTEKLVAPLDDETKLRLISKLKPGMKLMLDNMRFGEQNKVVPSVTFILTRG